MLSFILTLLGANPLGAVLNALNQAYKDKLTAANDADRIDADRRIALGEQQVAILNQAMQVRIATAGNWEQRLLAFIAGGVAIAHWAVIGIGTTFAAPLGWSWLQWTLHVPPFPKPYDSIETDIILSFFGLVGAVTVGKSIAGAIALGKVPPVAK